jgi:MEMO1 family protein
MGNIVYGAILPHPPILVPQIAGKRIKEIEKTKSALEDFSARLKKKTPDTIIVITPHGLVGQIAIPVYSAPVYEGNFRNFGLEKPNFKFKGDVSLSQQIIKEAKTANIEVAPISETVLDHGVLVPLYYPYKLGMTQSIVPIAIAFRPLKELFEFGKVMAQAIVKSEKKVAIIASSDMSHRLTPDAPAGFSPEGKKFDDRLIELVSSMDVKGILEFDPVLATEAGQDALWSISMLLGALDGEKELKQEILSYEGPFGVGYMVAVFETKGE